MRGFCPSGRFSVRALRLGVYFGLLVLVLPILFLAGCHHPLRTPAATPTIDLQLPTTVSNRTKQATSMSTPHSATTQSNIYKTQELQPVQLTPRPYKTPEKPPSTVHPTQTVTACPGAPKQRMKINTQAYICTQDDRVFLREQPIRSSPILQSLKPGDIVTIFGGPVCDEDWSYWQVETEQGDTGWVSEGGDDKDPYFLCPLEN